MKAYPPSATDSAEEQQTGALHPEPLLTNEDVLTDEEAFYLAQQEAFAALKARHARRPRRKI